SPGADTKAAAPAPSLADAPAVPASAATAPPPSPTVNQATATPPGSTFSQPPATQPATTAATEPASEPLPSKFVPPPAAAAKTDERIAAFVDAIKVTGIRSSGAESRVLMNDRVYKVNDIVERTLGVRLVKVAPDSLTFSDNNGFTYVKLF
ncbi:MAG: hypothetical protein V4773_02090, partial [Verrucomicrobiota bacterium]